MDAIDGVSKVFLMQHKTGAMHIHGARDEREMAERLLWRINEFTPEQHIQWLESLKPKIDEIILELKQDYEIDGHKRAAEVIE
jgi:truncated hemoglobin YjbI